MKTPKYILWVSGLALALLGGCGEEPNELPPKNMFLSDGDCAIARCNTYQTSIQAQIGPQGRSRALGEEDIDLLWNGPVSSGYFDYTYSDGTKVFWVAKIDRILKLTISDEGFKVINELRRPHPKVTRYVTPEYIKSTVERLDKTDINSRNYKRLTAAWRDYQTVSSPYIHALLTKDNVLFVLGKDRIIAYADEDPNNPESPIVKKGEFVVEKNQLQLSVALFTGLNLSHDGWLIIPNVDGTIIAVNQDFDKSYYYVIGREFIRRNITIDEAGGVYIVSDKSVRKIIWTGSGFTDDPALGSWEEPYELGTANRSPYREGRGSGSMAVLVGNQHDEDKLIALTDGADLNHLLLFWRNDIPESWSKLDEKTSLRLVARAPLKFADEMARNIYFDNTPIVMGYGLMLANNQVRNQEPRYLDTQLRIFDPNLLPFGVEKFTWNPSTKELERAWVRKELSIPNSTPVISASNSQVNAIGVKNNQWVVETIDWLSGETLATYRLTSSQRFNPLRSAVQLLDNGNLIYSAFGGLIHLRLGNSGK